MLTVRTSCRDNRPNRCVCLSGFWRIHEEFPLWGPACFLVEISLQSQCRSLNAGSSHGLLGRLLDNLLVWNDAGLTASDAQLQLSADAGICKNKERLYKQGPLIRDYWSENDKRFWLIEGQVVKWRQFSKPRNYCFCRRQEKKKSPNACIFLTEVFVAFLWNAANYRRNGRNRQLRCLNVLSKSDRKF